MKTDIGTWFLNDNLDIKFLQRTFLSSSWHEIYKIMSLYFEILLALGQYYYIGFESRDHTWVILVGLGPSIWGCCPVCWHWPKVYPRVLHPITVLIIIIYFHWYPNQLNLHDCFLSYPRVSSSLQIFYLSNTSQSNKTSFVQISEL